VQKFLLLGLSVGVVVSLSVPTAQVIGNRVRLESQNAQGVPVHPAAGDNSFGRWANGTIGHVVAIDAATGWIQVESATKRGWVTRTYVTVIPPDPEEPDPTGPEVATYGVGTWNLEHFRDGASRGFPENTDGGPTYSSRTTADLERIADTIKTDLRAQILILNEINGMTNQTKSAEMDRLVAIAGPTWQYRITRSGVAQRIAIMFDTTSVRLGTCQELALPEERVQDADIFFRDPLACSFTFLDGVQTRNDLVVVGLHLAANQNLVTNHNRAMAVLRRRLTTLFSDGTFPNAERDVLIGGDFNANRYDNKIEDFWTGFDSTGFQFRTLSPEDDELYPGTRLAGVPLFPRSKIDYLIGSARAGGIADELVQLEAEVHEHLLGNGFDDFREHVSDHLPVSVRVRITADTD
jgi:endonuclease/exonuclease/phosphatase family metal-dependent hydrolase